MKELVIFLHGYAATPESCRGLIEFFQQQGRIVYAPNFETGPFTKTDPDRLVEKIATDCDQFAASYPDYKILLCAHSMGCVFLKATILKWISLRDSTIGQAITQTAPDNPRVRTLLLASTNRGFRPQGIPNIGLEAAHRWFWLMMMMIAWCWLIRGMAYPPLQLIAAGATALILVIAAWLTIKSNARTLTGMVFLLTAATWIGWIFLDNWAITLVAIGLTALNTFLVSELFNYSCWSKIGLTLLSAVFVAQPFFYQPHFVWVWPELLLLAWPAMVWPWNTGLLVEHILFGSPWLTNIRMRWLEAFNQNGGARLALRPLPTMHLFGNRDRLVDEGDHEELSNDRSSYEFMLEGAHHKDFILTARPGHESSDTQRHSEIRQALKLYLDGQLVSAVENVSTDEPPSTTAAIFTRDAIPERSTEHHEFTVAGNATVQPGTLRRRWREVSGVDHVTRTRELAQVRTRQAAPHSMHVIFLIHGIRDFGEWQDALAAKMRAVANELGETIADVIIIRYGYFNAFQFLLWGERDRATRLFLDAYAQARSRFPNAKFHVAAHSNGTFVVANALLREEAMKLDHVYFAGSVVWRGFFGSTWPALGIQGDQRVGSIVRLRSDCASEDWPVGALCWWLSLGNRFRWGIIGTGGVDGFNPLVSHQVDGIRWLRGGHGEGLKTRRHEEIANYLLTGSSSQLDSEAEVNWKYLYIARAIALAGLLGIAVLYAITISFAPAWPLWGVAMGSLLTLVVVRIAMAV